jgi:hypothetical protein
VWAGSELVEIKVVGKKSHGAYPHEGIDAVAVAADLAGLDDWRMDYLETPKTPRQMFIEQFMAGSVGSLAAGLLDGPSTRRLQSMLAWVDEPMALLEDLRDPKGLYVLCLGCRVSAN